MFSGYIKKPVYGNDLYRIIIQENGVTVEFKTFDSGFFAQRWLNKRLKELNNDG